MTSAAQPHDDPADSSAAASPGWYAALTYALVGDLPPDLVEPVEPARLDPATYLEHLQEVCPGGLDGVRAAARHREPGLGAVPVELRGGRSAAQLLSALRAVRATLGLDAAPLLVRQDRPPSADDRRLQADVPPHHGA